MFYARRNGENKQSYIDIYKKNCSKERYVFNGFKDMLMWLAVR